VRNGEALSAPFMADRDNHQSSFSPKHDSMLAIGGPVQRPQWVLAV
jgi:hypothetical protein